MIVFGVEISQKEAYLIGVPLTIGIGFAGYALYQKLRSISTEREFAAGDEDLDLPLTLEHEYGDFRATCQKADSNAADYMNVLPEHFFHFNTDLSSYILTRFSDEVNLKRALVIGSSTAALAFELSKSCHEVKGIERSFTKVVTSYQFQNAKDVSYFFPLEGSHRTSSVTLNGADLFQKFQNHTKKYGPLQNIDIVQADPDNRLSVQLGQFQLIVLFKVLNTLSNPEAVLAPLHNFLGTGGFLMIVSDYNWTRFTNRHHGFNHPDVITTFDFLKVVLEKEFELVDDINMVDVVPMSLRSCSLHNYHVTTWRRLRQDA